jgi:hypothetical protein
METQADRDAIAAEAVGLRPGNASAGAHEKHSEELGRPRATATGAEASIAEKAAESVGERTADAYSDPDLTNRPASIGRRSGSGLTSASPLQRFLTLAAGFALGYAAAVFFHGRISAYFGETPEPFQITHPPQGESHPRGFVQSTVLRTVTEHPQGMTAAEIIEELGRQGISQQSIEHALEALVQANKVSSQEGRGGKYVPATDEVPTAPDRPSS